MLTLMDKFWILLYMLPFLIGAFGWMMWMEEKEDK